jgi:predicted RNA binding protein with dsRBD fold (UPF0201 family)
VIVAILTAISGLFTAAGKLFEWLYARQLVDAGRTQASLEALRKQVQDAQIAVAAREAVRAANARSVSIDERDPFLRD